MSRIEEVCLNKEKSAGEVKSDLFTVISGCYDVIKMLPKQF